MRSIRVFLICCVWMISNLSVLEAGASECSFSDARQEALQDAQNVEIKYDRTIVQYIEPMRQGDGSLIPRRCGTKSGRCYDYRFREIPLWFLDTEKCEVVSTVIVRRINSRGLPVLENSEDGIEVEIEEGPYGRVWNGYNTAYIVPGKPLIPLLGVWKSARRNSEPIYYTPHSLRVSQLFPDFAECGLAHIKKDLNMALKDLREKQVPSRAISDMLLADVAEKYFMEIVRYIPWIEQTDVRWFEEFEAGNKEVNPFRRVAELVCMNGDDAYDLTKSIVGASGIMQIYSPTCEDMLRPLYSEAELPRGCNASDDTPLHGHVEAHKAAIAHLDSTFNDFINAERGTGFFGFITRNHVNLLNSENGGFNFKRDLARGIRGSDVAELQSFLGVEADGVFGPITERALAEYQKEHLLSALAVLAEDASFKNDLGERQIAAYNGNVRRVISAIRTHLDKWDRVYLIRNSNNKLETPNDSLVYETAVYVRIFRYIRDNPEAIIK